MPAGSGYLEVLDFSEWGHALLPIKTLASTYRRVYEAYRGQGQSCSAADISANSTFAETPDKMA